MSRLEDCFEAFGFIVVIIACLACLGIGGM